mmetsp:Transcript_38360/g.43799  ORF Transcript_38360/g.43799 Transcript_38360/m.43799 type:complete len:80 (+) Transcript_38360:229-468(+)
MLSQSKNLLSDVSNLRQNPEQSSFDLQPTTVASLTSDSVRQDDDSIPTASEAWPLMIESTAEEDSVIPSHNLGKSIMML